MLNLIASLKTHNYEQITLFQYFSLILLLLGEAIRIPSLNLRLNIERY